MRSAFVSLSTSSHTSAGESLSEHPTPPTDMNFPIFLATFLVVTLRQFHMYGPLYLALSRCHPSFTPTSKANSAFHPSWFGKWRLASFGKGKEGMVHSVSGWTRGVQVKLWDPLRTRAIPERLRGVITTRRHTDPRLPLPYVYLHGLLLPYQALSRRDEALLPPCPLPPVEGFRGGLPRLGHRSEKMCPETISEIFAWTCERA